jgi:hypothetical protein
MFHRMKPLALCAFLFIATMVFTADKATPALVDPGIPNNETCSYKVTLGKDVYASVMRTPQKTESGRAFYEITSDSPRENLVVRMDRVRMNIVYSRVKRIKTDLVVQTETSILKNEVRVGGDEVILVDFNGLPLMLRCFPFAARRSLKLKTGEESGFVLVANLTRTVEVKTPAGAFRCHEIELGADGLLGGFFPKSYLWYTADAPHYLVKYQGQSGAPGSPTMVIELVKYEVR